MDDVRRRRFLLGATALLIAPRGAHAQAQGRTRKIGYLSWAGRELDQVLFVAFLQGLREHGYVEGRNVEILHRRGGTGELPALAAELVRLKVDIIVAIGTPAARAAAQATRTIPIVMTLIADPVAAKLIGSLAHPGGNVTGLSMLAPGIYGKGLEVLKQAAPAISRVAVLMDPSNPGHVVSKRDVDAVAGKLGVTVQDVDMHSTANLEAVFASVSDQHADALYLFPLRMGDADKGKLLRFAIEHRLPTLMTISGSADAGGLLFYGVGFQDQVRGTGDYIDRILKGTRPADLPVVQPTRFQLEINLKTAKAIGLKIPQSMLLLADRVIE